VCGGSPRITHLAFARDVERPCQDQRNREAQQRHDDEQAEGPLRQPDDGEDEVSALEDDESDSRVDARDAEDPASFQLCGEAFQPALHEAPGWR
jgi:hypothetical protein